MFGLCLVHLVLLGRVVSSKAVIPMWRQGPGRTMIDITPARGRQFNLFFRTFYNPCLEWKKSICRIERIPGACRVLPERPRATLEHPQSLLAAYSECPKASLEHPCNIPENPQSIPKHFWLKAIFWLKSRRRFGMGVPKRHHSASHTSWIRLARESPITRWRRVNLRLVVSKRATV